MNISCAKMIWYILVYSEIVYSETTEPVICDDNTEIQLINKWGSTLRGPEAGEARITVDYIPCAQILSYLVDRNSCKYNCKNVRREDYEVEEYMDICHCSMKTLSKCSIIG